MRSAAAAVEIDTTPAAHTITEAVAATQARAGAGGKWETMEGSRSMKKLEGGSGPCRE
jgi:hypothetical protein